MDQESNETVISLIKELQKQITYLERKIDTLVAQSAQRPSAPKTYGAPKRNFEERPRYGASRERTYGQGGQQRRDEGSRYVKKDKPFRPGDRDRGARRGQQR